MNRGLCRSGARGEEEGQVTHERGACRTQIGREGTAHASSSCSSATRLERIKREEDPLGMLAELPRPDRRGLQSRYSEDDRPAWWWGLYHDKPKIGTFMLRIKLPAGRVTPAQLRRVGELSSVRQDCGRALDAADDSASLPRARVAAGGVRPPRRGRADDRRRLRRRASATSPAALSPASRTTSSSTSTAGHRRGVTSSSTATRTTRTCRASTRSPIAACAHRCNAPEINCISLVGVDHETASPGFARARRRRPLVGAADRPRPRRLRPKSTRRSPVLRALLDAWKEDLRYRVSRVKARMKFMVDDLGPEGMRAEVERRLGYALPDFELPTAAADRRPHRRAAAEAGRPRLDRRPGARRPDLGRRRWSRSPSSRRALGGDVRVTRQQNFVAHRRAAAGDVDARRRAARASSACRSTANRIRADAIACTGEPHCNFSVTETKSRLDVARRAPRGALRRRRSPGLKLHLDGCPHACAQHWVGDLGFQGTTVRDEEGKRRQAYDIFLRGGARPRRRDRAAGLPARPDRGARRRPSRGLVGGWLAATRRRRELPRVLRSARPTTSSASSAGREPAKSRREEVGGMSAIELLDDLEAGELSVEFEGEEPRGRARVGDRAVRRPRSRSRRRSRIGDVALIDMAYRIDPDGARLLDRHGPPARPRRSS